MTAGLFWKGECTCPCRRRANSRAVLNSRSDDCRPHTAAAAVAAAVVTREDFFFLEKKINENYEI